jgi:hypothetical protein
VQYCRLVFSAKRPSGIRKMSIENVAKILHAVLIVGAVLFYAVEWRKSKPRISRSNFVTRE